MVPARMEEQLKKIIKRKFSASFMSNSKWKKLFVALQPVELRQAYWKFVDLEQEFADLFVTEHNLMDQFIGDCGLHLGPCAYRRIEWVEIPHIGRDWITPSVPALSFKQDVEGALSVLEAIGKFEIERTDRGIRIYGYK